MSAYLLKIVQLMKMAEEVENIESGEGKKQWVLNKLINEIGKDKYDKYQVIISELIDTMVYLHNNKEVLIFRKTLCPCF